MADPVLRPLFYEGQILAAGDLSATVDYDREQLARHDRYLHSWGVAEGLALSKKGTSIVLGRGFAIDGAGLSIIVAEDVALDEDDFASLKPAPANPPTSDWFPIFLVGADSAPSQAAVSSGACGGSAQQRRAVEGYRIVMDRPGTAVDPDAQVPPAPGDPAAADGTDRWRVLVGFVTWKDGHLSDAADHDASGTAVRYAGVRASEVSAHAGKLTLRSLERPAGQKIAVQLDNTASPAQVIFALEDKTGLLTPLVTVSATGDLTAVGKISGGGSQIGVYVDSGVVSDGMRLPLPAGITQAQVDSGGVQLQYHVSPHLADLPEPDSNPQHTHLVTTRRCGVNNMVVSCAMRWLTIDASAAPPTLTTTDQPGVCDYLVMAVVPAGK
jgi:hypothetical protein